MSAQTPTSKSAAVDWLLAILVPIAIGCGKTHEPRVAEPPNRRLNVLWIVWDTVRADQRAQLGPGGGSGGKQDRRTDRTRTPPLTPNIGGKTQPQNQSQ